MNKKIIFTVIIILVFSLLSIQIISGCSTPKEAGLEIEDKLQPDGSEEINLEDFPINNIAIDAQITTNEYPFSYFDNVTDITLYWHNDSKDLYIGLESQAEGWIAIGFDPERSMKDANIVLFALENENVIARDDYGTSNFSHSSDEELGGSFDITEYAGKKENNITTIEFVIPMDSGDEFDRVLEPTGNYSVIIAVNLANTDFNSKHSKKSSGVIELK